ncbi:MAG: SRPBCC family protein, partial [Stackebrandtia sp.]
MVADVSIVRDGDMLCASVSIPDVTASRALRAWLDPDELKRWWGGDLTIEPEVGGAYEVYFDAADVTMIGRIRNLSKLGTLRFTWSWLHEFDQPQRVVTVRVMDTDHG